MSNEKKGVRMISDREVLKKLESLGYMPLSIKYRKDGIPEIYIVDKKLIDLENKYHHNFELHVVRDQDEIND